MSDVKKETYWKDSDFVRLDRDLLVSLGFSFLDFQALSDKGLPEWTAPNINFDSFEPSNTKLKLGEDRDDQEVFVDLETFKVFVGKDETLVNSSAEQLLPRRQQRVLILLERKI